MTVENMEKAISLKKQIREAEESKKRFINANLKSHNIYIGIDGNFAKIPHSVMDAVKVLVSAAINDEIKSLNKNFDEL